MRSINDFDWNSKFGWQVWWQIYWKWYYSDSMPLNQFESVPFRSNYNTTQHIQYFEWEFSNSKSQLVIDIIIILFNLIDLIDFKREMKYDDFCVVNWAREASLESVGLTFDTLRIASACKARSKHQMFNVFINLHCIDVSKGKQKLFKYIKNANNNDNKLSALIAQITTTTFNVEETKKNLRLLKSLSTTIIVKDFDGTCNNKKNKTKQNANQIKTARVKCIGISGWKTKKNQHILVLSQESDEEEKLWRRRA